MKKLLAMLVLLLTISQVFAFNIVINPVDTSVKPGEVLEYEINLVNDASTPKTVVMYMISERLIANFEPEYRVTVPALTTSTVTLTAPVMMSTNFGRYYDSVYFEIGNTIQTSQTISYTVEGPDQYFIINSVDVNSQVDPRDEFNVTVNFENAYNDLIERVYTTIEIYEEDGTSLYYSLEVMETPVGNNSVSFPISLDASLPPTTANVRVSVDWYDISFGSKVEQFSIVGYVSNNTEALSSTSIVSSTSGILVSNEGTLVIQGFDHEIPVSELDAFFITSASVPYTLTSNSIIFHVPELYPGESIELSYETNYGVLYLLPFVFLGFVYLFYYFNRSIIVKREIFEFKSGANTIVFKVVLNITNVSKKDINRVRVKEVLPPIISMVYDYGTLKGVLKKNGDARFIEWNLGKLKPSENVILSYRMKSKVGFIGELSLDNGVVEVLDSEGSVKNSVRSNAIIIDIKPKDKQ